MVSDVIVVSDVIEELHRGVSDVIEELHRGVSHVIEGKMMS